jgi:hypothetical protein
MARWILPFGVEGEADAFVEPKWTPLILERVDISVNPAIPKSANI